jgi:uncharacterized protein YceK
MKNVRYPTIFLLALLCLSGCTQIVTAPISVAGSVVEAGFGMVGAAGGAVVDTVTGGDEEED